MGKPLHTRGYKPTGQANPAPDHVLHRPSQRLLLSWYLQVDPEKRFFGKNTACTPRDQSPWLLCSKTCDGSREGTSLGHPGNAPKFKGKAYTVGWGKNLTKVPTASWLLSCLQDRNTPSVNRNSQIFYFCWIGCSEIETKGIWNFIVLLAIIDPQYWLFPSSAEK